MVMDFLRSLNTFQVYENGTDNNMQSDYRYKFALPFEYIENPKEKTIIFQQHWYHSITISIVYFIVIKIIQHAMKDRKPFELRLPLFYWNGGLALFSILALVRFSEDFFESMINRGFYKTICYSVHPNDVAAYWCLAFAWSKVIELGDTLFIVLRKRPLIFLHYYHHAAVLIYTVHSGAEHTAPGRIFIWMNYLAHSFMYSYYAIRAYGVRIPRWISMAVTTIQTMQMLAGVAVTFIVHRIKTVYNWPCQQSVSNLYLAFIIYFTFALLFIQFFYDTYLTKKKAAQNNKKETKKIQ
ncbi:unnamed protein product [Auanema sp. JU1783]|nr:unnamed protein product [Auanema sp. JU1783]